MLTLLLDLIFPPRCMGCNAFATYLCPDCKKTMHFYTTSKPVDLDNPALDLLYAATPYKEIAQSFVKEVKFRGLFALIPTISHLMIHHIPLPEVDLLTYSPLHWRRERDRGFNQAHKMATMLGKHWEIPVEKLLTKNLSTTPQAELSRKERLTHLHQAFAYAGPDIQGKSIAIIDDVATTGTTLNECAILLKKHGAKKVIGIVFAHGS